ncbi:MAG: DUF4416 family protein, partial [Deltaproteobacteria bacterium]|nr:DUF4416 family protein [Deltaproteobacteria bacterium]
LAEIKISSQELESGYLWVKGGKKGRQVNIDPGYLAASKMVLATTKDASHRIYLGSGIYGEAALMFRHTAHFSPMTIPTRITVGLRPSPILVRSARFTWSS